MKILNSIKIVLFNFQLNQNKSRFYLTKYFSQSCPSNNLKHYQLDTPLFKKILTPELKKIWEIFSKYNYELRIAGGAIRDLLMNTEPHDIDLATNALPQQMIEIFEKEKIRIFNLNGIKHGTVSVRVDDKVNKFK